LEFEANDYFGEDFINFQKNTEYYYTKVAWHGIQPSSVSVKTHKR